MGNGKRKYDESIQHFEKKMLKSKSKIAKLPNKDGGQQQAVHVHVHATEEKAEDEIPTFVGRGKKKKKCNEPSREGGQAAYILGYGSS